jgi:hypothetical protein
MAISRLSRSSVISGTPKYQSARQSLLPVRSNLGYWLDATDQATITESGGAVSQWNDKSGNGINFLQPTSNKRPLLVTDQTTGNQFLRFDGSDDSLEIANSFWSGKTNYTIFWVFKWFSGSIADYEPIMTTTNSAKNVDNGSFYYINPSNRGACYPLYTHGNVFYDSGFSYTAGQTYINDYCADGTTYNIYRNSVFEGGGRQGGAPNLANNEIISICYQYVGGSNRWAKFDVGEIIVYNATLTQTQILDVRKYLNSKWGAY